MTSMTGNLKEKQKIKLDKRNYRIHGDKNKQLIKKSLDELGAGRSIVIDNDGDFIGGAENNRLKEGLLRKCMNSFFCSIDKRFDFVGRVNEDVNTYTSLGQRGELMFSYTGIMLRQKQTQSNKGGMTDLYLDAGTYVKSFYSVIFSPSCVKIATMGDKHKRIHHSINWEACCPKILNERWKK